MTALVSRGSTTIQFVGDSAAAQLPSSIFYFPSGLSTRVRVLRAASDGLDLLRRPAPLVTRLKDCVDVPKAVTDWEDQILAETVPLVGFMRMILHSGKYERGDRLSPQHQMTVIERLLPHHPEYQKKIGSGVDYIMIDVHPHFRNTKCLFIVRKDGETIDFSYWKCVKGLIRTKYPLQADDFILRHFWPRDSSSV